MMITHPLHWWSHPSLNIISAEKVHREEKPEVCCSLTKWAKSDAKRRRDITSWSWAEGCCSCEGHWLSSWPSFFLAVRLFVKCVHQLESVAIRLTWCERIRESICWHSGQRYVINADFTLHWIELAMIATSPPLIHPIKPSLFIYLQPQQPDMHGMSATRSPTHAHKKRNCAHFICGGQGHARRYLT